MTKCRRGDVVLVSYSNSDGATYKKRPALVIQADNLNTGIPQIVLAAISSQLYWSGPTRVFFAKKSKPGKRMGINRDSVVMTDNISTVLDREIEKKLGFCPAMHLVDDALRVTLGL